jgi:hypothetical protein
LCSHPLTKKNESIILPDVLCGCETWSLITLREEHRLREFENKVLRRIFGSKKGVTRGWRKLYEEFNNLCFSPNIN